MRLHTEDREIRRSMMDGLTGLELESHRIGQDGRLAQTKHPFPGHKYIDRDFSEAQIEINTPPRNTPADALAFLHDQLSSVHDELTRRQELLWPFSNPPVINDEEDIIIARYEGALLSSYHYRVYLAERYGKYKMTYSGIHFNYSFSEELMKQNYEYEKETGDFREYLNQFYLSLADKAICYSWAVVALLAASPVTDSSFFEKGKSGKNVFTGFSSLRCSEYGYWNPFLPILSYESVDAYIKSLESYLDQGMLILARELYCPVRVKPPGKYTLQALRDDGINHIELRQIDLNPFAPEGVDLRDVEFLKLLLIWLAAKDIGPLSTQDQMQALQNHKTAAAYDWDLAKLSLPGQKSKTLHECLDEMLQEMKEFYRDIPQAQPYLDYQISKTDSEENRYAWMVRDQYGENYIGKGIDRARQLQEAYHV